MKPFPIDLGSREPERVRALRHAEAAKRPTAKAPLFSRRAFCTSASALVVGTCACRAEATANDPARVGALLYEKEAGALRLHIYAFVRGTKRIGRCYVATAPRFEVVPSETIQTSLEFATPTVGDFAAINGGFYDEQKKAMGFVRHATTTHRMATKNGGSGVMIQTPKSAKLLHRSEAIPSAATEGIQSIDRLVVRGKVVVGAQASGERDARSAVMLDAAGAVSLVAVIADAAESTRTKLRTTGPLDVHTRLNERSSTTGLSLGEFATLLALPSNRGGLGARDALNLDGGYSTSFAARIGDERIRIEPHRATINAVRVRAGI